VAEHDEQRASRRHFANALAEAGFGFEAVDPNELRALVGLSRLIESERGAPLFIRDADPAGLYCVHEGEYELSFSADKGRRQIVRLADAGKLITEGLSPEKMGCRVDCIARGPARAWLLPTRDLLTAAEGCAPLAVALMRLLAHRQARLLDLVHDLSLRGVEQRLAAFLLAAVQHEGGSEGPVEISRDLPVQTIAEMLGTTRAEVTRAQANLQKAGIIEVLRDRVRVLNLQALVEAS
jgi:CRP/FNR family transcriptional regulator